MLLWETAWRPDVQRQAVEASWYFLSDCRPACVILAAPTIQSGRRHGKRFIVKRLAVLARSRVAVLAHGLVGSVGMVPGQRPHSRRRLRRSVQLGISRWSPAVNVTCTNGARLLERKGEEADGRAPDKAHTVLCRPA